MNTIKEIEVRGQTFHLLPDGLLYWPEEEVLAVADFHLGKAETFGMNGFPLPGEDQIGDLGRLTKIIESVSVRYLLFLGDLIHTHAGITPALIIRFSEWLEGFHGEVVLVIGNHDRHIVKKWPPSWKKVQICEDWKHKHFEFRHEPPNLSPNEKSPSGSADESFIWAGHVHPCVRLSRGADRLRLKTFVIARDYGILPAFSSLAGGFNMEKNRRFKFYPLAEGKVFEL